MLSKIRALYDHDHAVYFLLCMLLFGVASGLYMAVLNNYLHEILSISRMERGIIEFPRELPGLLLIFIIALMARFSELKVMGVALLCAFLGLFGLGMWGNIRFTAIIALIIFSTGEHIIMPIRNSVAMHMARKGSEGLAMGGVNSLRNIGAVVGHYTIPLLFFILAVLFPELAPLAKFRIVFISGSAVLLIGLIIASRIHETREHIERKKLVIKKKFTKYYILEMFFGARKQVFFTFAPYVLVLNYGAKTEYVAFLYGVWSFSNIFISPLMGKLLDRLGYKQIIVFDTILLTVLCLLYGFSHRLFSHSTAFIIISIVFVIDAISFIVGMARAMYVKSISVSQEEVTSTLSTGISINHLISIVIAVAGGILWHNLGIEGLFSLAAFFGAGSFVFALTLPSRQTSPFATGTAGK